MKDIHFISDNVTEEDKDLFFGPLTSDDEFVMIEEHWMMAHLLKEAGIFKSVSQARKNGGDKPIPKGFHEIMRGKRRHKFWILNT